MVSEPEHRLKGLSLPPPWSWGYGLVLRRKVLGEEDLSLEIFFLKRGILEGLVRRGVLASSPHRGALDPPALTHFQFQWLSQERVRIRRWEETRLFSRARDQAHLVLEFCHALTSLLPRGWWDPGLFRCILRSLRALEKGEKPEKVRILFRLGVLETTGHSPWHLLSPQHPSTIPPSNKYLEEDLEKVVNALWQDLLEGPPRRDFQR